MALDYILLDKKDGIATITFHRPEALNALNSQVLADLDAAVDEVSADPKVRVVVFTGEGKSFISGADINEMDGYIGIDIINYSRRGAAVFRKVELMTKPTIAAVNGYAFGGGFEFLLCTDIRIANEKAKLRLPEVTLGIVPGFNGTQRLPKCVGMNKAKEIIFTGKMLTAADGLELGILNKVVPVDKLMEETYAMASQIADNSASAIALTKAAMAAGENMDIDIGKNIELGYMAAGFGTPDQIEGFASFKERRPAKFR
ncbi:enoyl-CoA hydratase/isomerase family protein [Lacrimispora sp. 210928-DFI.3.58]|uniref:enoyl-CoA hydratase/isomerase family protein n=1 Tax=Lacrimispora sp. 210928-DFI.3.58 TaxID=2883214 RepID=UPI0015B73A78|nr:enoyl-CoA hydratase-related protein [Lacrimispora sp. 210928-DFI.3.58]MCB7321067.1 enoyl-CoA hydratase/isomerase family protein [Lacrimispora sp. 210928-DFI.3.58]